MSRSYKKTPAYTDTGKKFHRHAKREANVAVRHYKDDLSNGCSYKKLFDTWNICDYKCIYHPRKYRQYAKDLWERFENGDLSWRKYPDEESVLREIRKPRQK